MNQTEVQDAPPQSRSQALNVHCLTVTLLPKAGLLRWDEEEQEAKEYRDGGVRAVAFPSKDIHRTTGRELGILESCAVSGQAVGTQHLLTGPSLAVTAT